MRYFSPLFCFIILLSNTTLFAQISNPCSDAKTKSGKRSPIISAGQQATENKYDVKFHHLQLDVERDTTYISGSVRTLAQVVVTSLDSFAFELHPNLTIDSIRINGQFSVPVRNGNYVAAPLLIPALNGSMVNAYIYYHGTPPSGNPTGDGFSNGTSGQWGNQATWSLSESFGADEWWPSKQSLLDKIDSTYFFITTDTANKAGSNGILTNVVNLGNGKNRYEWKNIHPLDYYLVSVAVAKYVEYDLVANPYNCPQPVTIQNYIYDNPATLTTFKSSIDQTKDFIELFSKLYGPYPFWDQKYGHCMAPFGGGMEHQTMTSLGSFDFSLVSHELSHQWFGDNVTCKTWSDIFVNEGFASYSEDIALQNLAPASAPAHMLTKHNNIMSQPGGSIWFTDSSNVNRIFDSRLSYDKGAAFLHWIRFELNNDSTFFKVYRTYQQQFHNSTASALDFKSVLENVSGQSFTILYNEWFFGEGFPTFNERWNQEGTVFHLRSQETVSMPSITPLIITPVEYKLSRSIGDTIVRLNQTDSIDYYSFSILGTVTAITVDPANWIVNGVGTIIHDPSLLGITEYQTNGLSFQMYPNPATDYLRIEFLNSGSYELCMSDLSGKMLMSKSLKQSCDLSLSGISPGTYLITMKDTRTGKVTTHRFVKD